MKKYMVDFYTDGQAVRTVVVALVDDLPESGDLDAKLVRAINEMNKKYRAVKVKNKKEVPA